MAKTCDNCYSRTLISPMHVRLRGSENKEIEMESTTNKAKTRKHKSPEPSSGRKSRPYNLSNLLLRFLVLLINFLYLCFFIFNFRCLFTLIALHVMIFVVRSCLHCSRRSCLIRIRSRNGCRICTTGRSCISSMVMSAGNGDNSL